MFFLIFESMFNSRIHHKNLKSQVIYELYTFRPPLLAMLVNKKSKEQNAANTLYFIYYEKTFIRRKVKLYMCYIYDTLNGKKFWKICVTLQWHISFHYINGQF